MLTPVFGMAVNIYKMASNKEVFNMKKFCIINMIMFEVWVVTSRFHLEGRNCAQSNEDMGFSVLFCQFSPPYCLIWTKVLHELSLSRRADRF